MSQLLLLARFTLIFSLVLVPRGILDQFQVALIIMMKNTLVVSSKSKTIWVIAIVFQWLINANVYELRWFSLFHWSMKLKFLVTSQYREFWKCEGIFLFAAKQSNKLKSCENWENNSNLQLDELFAVNSIY